MLTPIGRFLSDPATVVPAYARTYSDPMGRTQFAVDGPRGTFLVTRHRAGDPWEIWRSDTTYAVARAATAERGIEIAAERAGVDTTETDAEAPIPPAVHNTHVYGQEVAEFSEGQRIALRPCCDAWMRGDRFGVVESVGRTRVYVRMDRSQALRPIHPSNLAFVAVTR